MTPNYQAIIDLKYKALGWTITPDNSNHAESTVGATGWVQYYGNKSQAIYFFNGVAYGMYNNELKKYDAIGQDKFAILTADAAPTSDGTYYNEFSRVADGSAGVIVTSPNGGTFLVYGDIYLKYLALNRWAGVLGYPTNDESTNNSGRRYNNFASTSGAGCIVAGPAGSQAIWGKVYKMWLNTEGDTGWLGNPTSSCDPTLSDNGQLVKFQNGTINITTAGCGQYKKLDNTIVPANGSLQSTVLTKIPCY